MSLTLETFNENFVVTVVSYKEENNGSSIKVCYKVSCKQNGRVSVHIATVDTTSLSVGYTNVDVVQAGWSTISTVVNQWAAYNLVQDKLNTISITSTTNDISVADFNEQFTINVIRFEPVSIPNPTQWCIGFSISLNDNVNINRNFEGYVNISDYCNNTLCAEIATTALNSIKEQVCGWACDQLVNFQVLNKLFTPTAV
jgi:hypothetical protein